jgi:hypothetical protein
MKKEKCIERYGEDEYERRLTMSREWNREHPEEHQAGRERWEKEHPEKVAEYKRRHHKTGIQGLKNKVRTKDADFYRRFKKVIAPTSQLHHEWSNNGTAEYTGVALVEADQHMYGFVEVIHVVRGEISLFTEASLQGREETTEW